jgi:predicted DNA-binding transcriptional regulator YafY
MRNEPFLVVGHRDPVRDTATRLLALLSLLQARPDWSGAELALRLGVTTRTIRKDVRRLRDLGYPVDAVPGPAGHYRLGVGATLPPLLLDDEEAVAVAVGLRSGTGVSGIEESSARALAKLDRVLPHRLRRTVAALSASTSRGPDNTSSDAPDPQVDPAVLTGLAAAIHDRTGVRLTVDGAHGADGPPRLVDPYRLVNWQRRWFLVGREAGAWQVLRVDRIALRTPGGPRFTPVAPPDGGYTDLVLRTAASAGWAVHARIEVAAPADEVLARINPTVGVVETVDARRCVLVTGADSLATVAAYIGMLGLDFRVTAPPELVAHVRLLGERYRRATSAPL